MPPTTAEPSRPTTKPITKPATSDGSQTITVNNSATEVSTTDINNQTYTIEPKIEKAKIKKVTYKKSTKKISVTLTKIKKAKKYKTQVSKAKNFKKNVVTKTTNKLKVTIKSKKFKNAKKVYVRAKAIVTLGDGSMEGPWSKIKKVKIKK